MAKERNKKRGLEHYFSGKTNDTAMSELDGAIIHWVL